MYTHTRAALGPTLATGSASEIPVKISVTLVFTETVSSLDHDKSGICTYSPVCSLDSSAVLAAVMRLSSHEKPGHWETAGHTLLPELGLGALVLYGTAQQKPIASYFSHIPSQTT